MGTFTTPSGEIQASEFTKLPYGNNARSTADIANGLAAIAVTTSCATAFGACDRWKLTEDTSYAIAHRANRVPSVAVACSITCTESTPNK